VIQVAAAAPTDEAADTVGFEATLIFSLCHLEIMLLCTHKHAMFHLMLPAKWCHGCKLGITALLGHAGCWIAGDEIRIYYWLNVTP
jgi:hypothetical protein